nr:HEPN domain-containing protein [uncultured Pseudomonas sp.]
MIKESGYFWWRNEPMPEDDIVPESAVAGDLIISEDGQISLELHGYLPSADHPMSRIFEGAGNLCPHIEGRLKNTSEHVLLMDVYTQGGKASFGGISFENYGATSCLIGSQPLPIAKGEIKFDGLSIPLTGFEDWLGLRSIETSRTKRKLVAVHKTRKDIKYTLEDSSAITIKFDLLAPMLGKQKNYEVNISEKVSFDYLSKTKKTSSELKKYFLSISDFFLILTGSDYSMEWPSLTVGRTTASIKSYRFYFLKSRNLATPPARHNCWLTFPTIQEEFGQLFQQWQIKREELGPGMSLYLGTRRGVQLYVEHRFVNLIWGLESLHRTLNKDAPPTKLELKALRIIEQIKLAKDRKWLEAKLEHSAEPSLAERLVECVELLPLNFSAMSLRAFCNECAYKRNDISHFGGQRSGGGYGEFLGKIYSLNNALGNIYPAILLKLCGVNDSLLLKIFSTGFTAGRIKVAFSEVGLHVGSRNYLPSVEPSKKNE